MGLKRLLRKSIRLRTIFSVILILGAISIATIVVNFIQVHSIIKTSVNSEIYASGLIVRRTITVNLKYFNLNNLYGVNDFLKSIVSANNKISYIYVANREGRVLYSSRQKFIGRSTNINSFLSDVKESGRASISNTNHYEIVIPILSGNILSGYIHLGFNKNMLAKRIRVLIFITIIIFVISSIISAYLVLLFLTKRIINPIADLSLEMKNITQSMVFDEIKIKGEDEISELGNTFNFMIREIKNYSDDLEELVKKRTKELNNANVELNLKSQRIDRELKMAATLQKSIMPKDFPLAKGLKFASYISSIDHIGGDYYDVFSLDATHFGILISDVSGHGIPAALVTMMAKVAFATYSKKGLVSDVILERVNRELVKVFGRELTYNSLSAFYMIIDIRYNLIQFSNAGHPSPIVFSSSENRCFNLSTFGKNIGISENSLYGRSEIFLDKGDKIVLYTNGLIETKNRNNQMFGVERLIDVIFRSSACMSEELIRKIKNEVEDFSNNQVQVDDWAILVVDITEKRVNEDIKYEYNKKRLHIEEQKKNADASFKNKEYVKALAKYIDAMEKEGRNDCTTMEKIGDCYYELGNFAKAADYYEYSVTIEPENDALRKKFNRTSRMK